MIFESKMMSITEKIFLCCFVDRVSFSGCVLIKQLCMPKSDVSRSYKVCFSWDFLIEKFAHHHLKKCVDVVDNLGTSDVDTLFRVAGLVEVHNL